MAEGGNLCPTSHYSTPLVRDSASPNEFFPGPFWASPRSQGRVGARHGDHRGIYTLTRVKVRPRKTARPRAMTWLRKRPRKTGPPSRSG